MMQLSGLKGKNHQGAKALSSLPYRF